MTSTPCHRKGSRMWEKRIRESKLPPVKASGSNSREQILQKQREWEQREREYAIRKQRELEQILQREWDCAVQKHLEREQRERARLASLLGPKAGGAAPLAAR